MEAQGGAGQKQGLFDKGVLEAAAPEHRALRAGHRVGLRSLGGARLLWWHPLRNLEPGRIIPLKSVCLYFSFLGYSYSSDKDKVL